jgi:hypothetical protein
MKVTINGQPIHIRWNYKDVEIEIPGTNRVATTQQTACIASMNRETVAEEVVRRYYLDPITTDKDPVRKLTLGRLLQKMFPGPDNKSTRAEFWHTYLNRSSKKKVEAPVVQLEPVIATSA